MDNKKYDDLDKLFQSRLKNDQVVNEEWNQAPPAPFEGAMAVLDKRANKKKRFFFWLIFAASLLTGLIIVSIFNFNKINKLESKIEVLQKENVSLNSSVNSITKFSTEKISKEGNKEINSDKSGSTNQNIQENKKENQQEGIFPKPRNINNTVNTNSSKFYNSNIKSGKMLLQEVEIKRLTDENLNEELINSELEEGSNATLNENISFPNDYLKPIPLLPLKKPEVEDRYVYLISEEIKLPPEMLEELCITPTFSIYALGGVNASTIKMTNTEGADFSLTGYERYYADAFTGVGVDYYFDNKWSVNLQATYNKLHVKSAFEDDITYDKSLELIDLQGNARYESDYEVYTVMGRQSSDLSFALSDISIDDQDELKNQTQIDNSFETFGLSIATNYKLYCNEKITIDIGLGVQYNHLLDIGEEMQSSIFHENTLMLKESVQSIDMGYGSQNYWSLLANTRFAYKINDHSGLRLDLGSSHSVTSIRKSYSDLDSKTYINNLKASIQFYHSF